MTRKCNVRAGVTFEVTDTAASPPVRSSEQSFTIDSSPEAPELWALWLDGSGFTG